jgi:hypothetical protein
VARRGGSEIYNYIPTKEWLCKEDPSLIKKEMLAWYERRKKILKARLRKPITTMFEYTTEVVDFQTGRVIKKSKKASQQKIEKWRLSQQDYDVYLSLLNRRFEKLKKEYNQKVKKEKEK